MIIKNNIIQDNIKALLFDFGGTIDTQGMHWSQVIWDMYQFYGIPVSYEDFAEAYVYVERLLGSDKIICQDDTLLVTLQKKLNLQFIYLTTQHKLGIRLAEIKAYSELLAEDIDQNVRKLIAQNKRVLTELRRKFKVGLITNFYGNITAVLRDYALNDIFECVVESAREGVRKPDPTLYKIGIKKIKSQPENVLVIGDSIKNDIRSAKTLGCHTAWLQGRAWREEQKDMTDDKISDVIITSLSDLLDIL